MPSPIKPSNSREIAISQTTNRQLATVPSKDKHQLTTLSKEIITPLSKTETITKKSTMPMHTKPPHDALTIEEIVIRKLGTIPEFSALTKEEIIVALQYAIKINLNSPEVSQKSPMQSDMIIVPGIKKILFLGEHSDQFAHTLYRIGEQYSINLEAYDTISLTAEEWAMLAQFLANAAEALKTLYTAQKTEQKTENKYKSEPTSHKSTTQTPTTTPSETLRRETSRREEEFLTESHATQEFRKQEKDRKKRDLNDRIERKELERERLKDEQLKTEVKKKAQS